MTIFSGGNVKTIEGYLVVTLIVSEIFPKIIS